MILDIERYRKVVDALISKSFPQLTGKKIIVSEFDVSSEYSATTTDFIFFGWIIVFKKSRKYSIGALKGILAHELSHLAIIKNMKFFEKVLYFGRWIFSKKIKADFETRADLMAIKKGYGKDLMKFKKEWLKGKTKVQLKERYKKGYLSPEEIKSYAKKIGK